MYHTHLVVASCILFVLYFFFMYTDLTTADLQFHLHAAALLPWEGWKTPEITDGPLSQRLDRSLARCPPSFFSQPDTAWI